jgi:CRISPR/Cas system-associated exonuclease Cas4 (RecB family)
LDPGYVLDRMEFYEISALIENAWMKSKESWEQARLQAYLTAQVNSTKKIDMTEFMTFPWEKVETEKIEDTKEEREAVMKEMKEWENIMNNKR